MDKCDCVCQKAWMCVQMQQCKCVCWCSHVLVHACVHVFVFSYKDKSTLIIMPKPWSNTAVMYHASQTSLLLSLPSYFTVSSTSFLSLINNTTRSVLKWSCTHVLEHNRAPSSFQFSVLSRSPPLTQSYEHCTVWYILHLCSHVCFFYHHVCLSRKEHTATVSLILQ